MKSFHLVLGSFIVPALIGCSSNFTPLPDTTSATGVTIKGTAHGGEQPLGGSRIYLFAAGKAGYGSASTSLLNTAAPGVSTDTSGNGYVATDAGGNFNITGDYTCANGSDQVYLLATGGNPGLAAGTNNSAIALVDLLGACSTVNAGTFAIINELSTAAAGTALSQFITDPTHIGSSAANSGGLANAVVTAMNMVDVGGGPSARDTTRAGNGTVPQATVNTLADILASCVNTASSTSSPCASLFSASTPAGGSAPTNTLNAVANIASHATANVATLYGLVPTSPPFQPVLTTQPADWTVGISYTLGVATALPGYVAVDGSGNVWISNQPSGRIPNTTDSIVKLGPDGSILSGTGFTNNGNVNLPEGLAIDDVGTVWIANQGNVLRINNDGSNVTGFPVSATDFAQDIALDRSGNAWVTNYGSTGKGTSVTEIGNNGTVLNAGASSPGFIGSQGTAIDSLNNVWAAGQSSNSLLELSSTGTVKSGAGAGFTGGGLKAPTGVAIDHLNRVWVANSGTGDGTASLSLFNNDGTAISSTSGYGFGAGGFVNIISIDGASSAWTASCGPNCIGGSSQDRVVNIGEDGNVLNAPGFLNPTLSSPQAIAVDASGNVWVGNAGNGTVTQLVGVAMPVKTPIQAGLKTGLLGARP